MASESLWAESSPESGEFLVTVDDRRTLPETVEQPTQLSELIKTAVLVTLKGEQVASGCVDILLVDEPEMAELNIEHMHSSGPTDVLAFPIEGPDHSPLAPQPLTPSQDESQIRVINESSPRTDAHPETDEGSPPVYLGDIVICLDYALRQAAARDVDATNEVALLASHGMLHILGYDHAEPEQATEMRLRERVHLKSLNLKHPLHHEFLK